MASNLPAYLWGSASPLPEADLNRFFRILRFLSAHPELTELQQPLEGDAAVGKGRGGAGEEKSGCRPSGVPTPLSGADAASASHPSQETGTSASVNNRIRTPAVLSTPLEEYRMAATNLPLDQERLAATRRTVCTLLEDLCLELADPAVTKVLHAEVLCTEEGGATASPAKTVEPRRVTLQCSPLYRGAIPHGDCLTQMQEIIPGLWCGSYHPSIDRALLLLHGITHICCCIGTQPRFPSDFMYLTITADDAPGYDMKRHFAQTFEFLENALVKSHGAVLVHCGAGISRATTVVAAYLIRKLRISAPVAIRIVQHHRPCASPNVGFRRQLREYSEEMGVGPEVSSERVATAEVAEKKQPPGGIAHEMER